jgi:hypothetical protein
MRRRDERWVVTIWQPERPLSTTNPPTSGIGGYNDAIDHVLKRREYEVERAVVINGRLVTVRKQREEE